MISLPNLPTRMRMRHAGRNDDPDIVAAAVIIAIDDEAHGSRRHPRAHIPQDHLRDALDNKHHVPLLFIGTDGSQ